VAVLGAGALIAAVLPFRTRGRASEQTAAARAHDAEPSDSVEIIGQAA
jgi:hypothetical protein